MNVQQLIEKYKRYEGKWNAKTGELARQIFLQDLEQLDKPQKVKVPQFVADYIEYAKKEDYHILGAMSEVRKHENKDIEDWLYTDDNIEIFARAWLDGYEVDKEKRYMVKMKGLSEYNSYLNYDSIDDEWYFTDAENGPAVGTHHTRKELEDAGFGEVFNSPLFEVEEVE